MKDCIKSFALVFTLPLLSLNSHSLLSSVTGERERESPIPHNPRSLSIYAPKSPRYNLHKVLFFKKQKKADHHLRFNFFFEMGSLPNPQPKPNPEPAWSPGPIIVGAGPSGLAVAACLANLGVPSTVLEKSTCLASLWQHRTYNRLKLHLPKHFCHLPLLPFPPNFPKYPSKHHFISYVESYAAAFGIEPRFGCAVDRAEFDRTRGAWVVTVRTGEVYASRWLVVATGENAEPHMPEMVGMERFEGRRVVHTCGYRCGGEFRGERVLVVGCGNSGMEVSLDLCRHSAKPYLVVRNNVSIIFLPN